MIPSVHGSIDNAEWDPKRITQTEGEGMGVGPTVIDAPFEYPRGSLSKADTWGLASDVDPRSNHCVSFCCVDIRLHRGAH